MGTDKQNDYAKKLGIENPEQYDSKVLSAMIDQKIGKSKKAPTQASNSFTATTQTVINKTENADSIEWRLATGKGVKCYGDASNPEDFKQRLKVLIDILKSADEDEAFLGVPAESVDVE